MLESMLGPEVMDKIMAKLASLICVICGWIGLIMVMMTSFVSTQDSLGNWTIIQIYHAHLWPMLIGFFCAGAALVYGRKKAKINLCYVLFLVSFWVMLDTFMKFAPSPSLEQVGMGEAIVPMMAPVGAIGGFLGLLGSAVGIMGAGKYEKA
jgi:hypothetical protein